MTYTIEYDPENASRKDTFKCRIDDGLDENIYTLIWLHTPTIKGMYMYLTYNWENIEKWGHVITGQFEVVRQREFKNGAHFLTHTNSYRKLLEANEDAYNRCIWQAGGNLTPELVSYWVSRYGVDEGGFIAPMDDDLKRQTLQDDYGFMLLPEESAFNFDEVNKYKK